MTGFTVSRRDLSSESAMALVQAAVAMAAAEGLSICAVAVDSGGLPLALRRMDGVREPVVTFATDKAWTAATMRRPTEALRLRMQDETLRHGTANRARLMFWGGGIAVFADGECIGALGVSGGKPEDDIRLAEAAVAATGLQSIP